MTDLLAKYQDNPEDMRKAGIEYATDQIRDLREHSVKGIHIYTMNNARTAGDILAQL